MTYCLGKAERKPTSAAAPDLAKSQVRRPFAPRARLERATYCLGGITVTLPEVAGCGLTCHSAVAITARCGLPSLQGCGRWLPVWLPGILLAELIFQGSAPYACRRTTPSRHLRPVWLNRPCIRRWLSLDTALRDRMDAAYRTSRMGTGSAGAAVADPSSVRGQALP